MMCDTTNRSFRAQLAAVLDKLTKAALVEIGNLADECSSVLHTEISLHKTENEALKKRCYLLEVQLRAAREAQTYPGHVNSVSRRHPAGQDGPGSGLSLVARLPRETVKYIHGHSMLASLSVATLTHVQKSRLRLKIKH